MVQIKRWFKAQKHERYFWGERAKSITVGALDQLNWYEWKANELEKLLKKLSINILSNNPNVLEIGSGPIGIINYLNYGTCFSIDPLEDYYKSNPTLIKLRNNNVLYLKGTGENLPFANNKMIFVIIDNVIDHTYDPFVVISEIYRTLKHRGIMYLSVNVHTNFGAKFHNLLAMLNIDSKHPHTYTDGSIRKLLQIGGFKIIHEDVENYKEVKKKNTESRMMKHKIKGYSGLSEMIYYAVCLKE